MKKTYLNESIMQLSEEEKRTGRASYARVLKMYAGDMVLCNEIANIDDSVYENISIDNSEEIEEIEEKIEEIEEKIEALEDQITEESSTESDEEISAKIKELEQEKEELEEEKEELENAAYNTDIYQWYLCNLSQWQVENLQARGIITSYSNMLDCDIIAVDHWGTAWDYVSTGSELTTDLNA